MALADAGNGQVAGAEVSWDRLLKEISGATGAGLNIATAVLGRQIAAGLGARPALRWLGRRHERRIYSYADLDEVSGRAAAVLGGLGLKPGDAVAVLLGRVPDLFAVAFGVWKAGGVYCPLFTAFGPGPIRARLELARARVLIASEDLYARKVAGIRAMLPQLEHVLLVADGDEATQPFEGCSDFRALLAAASPVAAVTTSADDPAFLHFTSGTSGTPRGAIHSHRTVLALEMTGRQVFGLGGEDIFWCTADPGWVTATAYGMISPLINGATALMDEADIDPRRWYTILRDEGVTAWYTTPTAIRTMMRYGAALARTYRQNTLRVAASVGEPLNAEAVMWGQKALGVPFLDTWWQTEIGAIAIANLPGTCRRPGSIGRVLPGAEVAVVQRTATGVTVIDEPEVAGELAVREGWPAMFRNYVGKSGSTPVSFADGWFLTGDLVKCDADGFYWFLGRADDMIKCGALRIGPFEVEGALMDHPAVAEIGVVGKSDLLLREVPVAFVSLNPGFEAGDALRAELLNFARQELGSTMAPREIHFVEGLPKTSSGKIIRRVLKARAVEEQEEADPVPTTQSGVGRYDDE
jgi:acetyl-CoA synthetase